MKYSIEINAEDVLFIIEAIKLRAFCLADDIERQANNITAAHNEIDNSLPRERTPTPSEVIKDAIKFNVIKKRRGRPAKPQETTF